MTYRHSGTAIAVCLAALSLTGCSDRDVPTAAEPPVIDETPQAPAPAAPSAPTARQQIQVGQTANGTINSRDDTCEFWSVDGGWGGLCNAFEITAPASGVLKATVRWPADAALAVFAKTSTGRQIDLACCGTPMVLELPVDRAPRAENLRWDWTIAEALVLGLSGWLWKVLSVDGKDETHGRVYAIAGYGALLLVLARVLGTIWPPLVTASYAVAGAALLIASSKGEGRLLLLRLVGGTMLIVVARLIVVDMSSVETIWRVLLFLACGVAFVGTSYRMRPPRTVPPAP